MFTWGRWAQVNLLNWLLRVIFFSASELHWFWVIILICSWVNVKWWFYFSRLFSCERFLLAVCLWSTSLFSSIHISQWFFAKSTELLLYDLYFFNRATFIFLVRRHFVSFLNTWGWRINNSSSRIYNWRTLICKIDMYYI